MQASSALFAEKDLLLEDLLLERIQPLPAGIRFLLYCHDTFGLGHLRRTLSLAAYFTAILPEAEALIVTGSPMAHAFPLPPHVDYVKLPAVTKSTDGEYRARSLNMEVTAIRDLRATLLRETVQAYGPDVFLVDHAPLGLQKEALPALTLLQAMRPECLRVLGLRDIIDASSVIRSTWAQEEIYSALENTYDLILVYGAQKLYDVVAEYALPPTIAQRVHYCGYLDRLMTGHPQRMATYADARTAGWTAHADRLVVLTVGGGGDGFWLAYTYLLGLYQLASVPFTSVLLTGPLMDAGKVCELRALAATLPAGTVHIDAFLPDPLQLLSAADLVVSMAGYNTVCELLALGQRTLLVPRTTPRQEQFLRATLLAQHGLVHVLHPADLTPERLMESILHCLAQPRPRWEQLMAAGISFHGQVMAVCAIVDALRRRQQHVAQAAIPAPVRIGR
jgi:predicted glycosyltransferase